MSRNRKQKESKPGNEETRVEETIEEEQEYQVEEKETNEQTVEVEEPKEEYVFTVPPEGRSTLCKLNNVVCRLRSLAGRDPLCSFADPRGERL